MAGKQLRSRCIPESAKEFCQKSKVGRARLHLQVLHAEGSAVQEEVTRQCWKIKAGKARLHLQVSHAEGSDVQEEVREWELQKCVSSLEDQVLMKGIHARQQVPLSLSSSSNDGTTSNEESDAEEVELLSDKENGSMQNTEKHKSVGNQHAKKTTDDKISRLIVDNDHVASLVRDYRKYFMEFSRGRKKMAKQLIPNKVWTNVYRDYKKKFPRSAFRPESLKIHLREALTDLQSGVNNPEAENNQEGGELQDGAEMRALYNTDGFLRRNVLQVRERSMDGSATKKRKELFEAATPASKCTLNPPTQQSEKEITPSRPFTKKETLKQAGEDIASMLGEVKTIKEKQVVDAASKRIDEEIKASLAEARREESTARREESSARLEEAAARRIESTARCEEAHSRKVFQDKQNILAEIGLLEKQRDVGLLNEYEFKEKCRSVFGC